MNAYFSTLNAFIEDTCVLVVIASLLARGPLLELLFRERLARRNALTLGGVLGLIGLTEAVFPGARYPYVTSTLIVAFAALNSGIAVGVITAGVDLFGAALLLRPASVADTAAAVVSALVVGGAIHRLSPDPRRPLEGAAAGLLAQAGALGARVLLSPGLHTQVHLAHAAASIPANGFGVMLLQIVVGDARIRAASARNKEEAERAHALVAEAQLAAVRARVHPHFLYNALTSIAALCSLDPPRAEAAIVRLSQLMRRALEANPGTPIPLEEEMEHTRAYLDIEQQRFGLRLQVVIEVPPECGTARVPPFAVQTLAENAVLHGVSPRVGAGCVRVLARKAGGGALVAVTDNGVGMSPGTRSRALTAGTTREHGLQILSQQLVHLYGSRGRLRILTRENGGTIAAFVVKV